MDKIFIDIKYFSVSVSVSTCFINSINKYDIICSILINYHNAENSNSMQKVIKINRKTSDTSKQKIHNNSQ